VKDAHRVFMLFSVGNMFSFCIAMLAVSWWWNRYQQWPRDGGVIPPVVYYVCGCVMITIMVLLHFVVLGESLAIWPSPNFTIDRV
jgi:hypothetical protein